ncbi:MAG: hypothetical protein RLZZ203_752 [Cyanobacteriota bacterium]
MTILGEHRQIFLFSLSFYFLAACSQNQPVNQVITSQCPTQPTAVLETNNVKPISLGSQAMKETGMVTTNKSLGYTFTAKSGEKLVYKTSQDICIWVYTPDNQLINSPILPLDGKYTVQVAAMGGSTTFDLGLELEDNNTQAVNLSSSSTSTPLETTSPTSTPTKTITATPVKTSQINRKNSTKQDPRYFIRNHYLSLNNRNYSQTRNQLSNRFKNKYSGTYAEYQQWWDSVKKIKIGKIEVVNQNTNTATVDAELSYYMNTGRIVQDSRSRIYLIWNQNDNTWLINDKSEP